MGVIRAEEMSYTTVRGLDPSRTVAFLPVSALEVHGPHLPLGMDFYMARWMAEEAGRRFAERHPDWTVVQFPALPLGTDELPLPGSMDARSSALMQALEGHGRSLARAGYRYIVVTNGHGGPRHAAGIELACRRVSRRCGVQMFSPAIVVLHRIVTGQRLDFVEALLGRGLSPEERHGLVNGEHAGTWETSFMLAMNPALVEPSWRQQTFLKPPKLAPLMRLGEWLVVRRERRGGDARRLRQGFEGVAGGLGWMLNTRYGYGGPPVSYSGDPSVASGEVGHAFRELLAADCLEVVESVTSGRRDAREIRSVASEHYLIRPGVLRQAGVVAAALFLWWFLRA